jgi:hypothetical protein
MIAVAALLESARDRREIVLAREVSALGNQSEG